MSRARKALLAITAIVGLAIGACAGITARKHVMIPAIKKMWPSIEKRALRGMDSAPMSLDARAAVLVAMASMKQMLKDRDVDRASQIRWDLIKVVALLGIDDMLEHEEIGPGVAESLREGIRLFDEAFKRLL